MRARPQDIRETRAKVRQAFKTLQKEHDILARMNYKCCTSCATAALENRLEEDPSYKGGAYFHRQDNENFEKGRNFFIGFGGDKESNMSMLEVGQKVNEVLQSKGVETDWEESEHRRIEVVQER